MTRSLILLPLLLAGFHCPPFLTTAGAAAHSDIRIAVLALRGEEAALQSWQATADYLNRKIPSQQFRIVPYDFTAIVPAARQHAYHFVITNPSIYIELEELCGASRIATLRRQVAGQSQTRFGGVIFCRSERTDLQTLTDLKNRRFMAAGENSLGGWRMAWYELKAAGIEPAEHFAQLRFGGSHDAVVAAVAQGAVDAGTVRTGILEDLAATGVIRLTDFRILQPRQHEGFDLLHSTDLYPEWPIAVLPQTDASLAQQVTIALLEMADNDPAAQAAASVGWTIPQDYTRLHELFKALRLGPYRDYGSFTFAAVLRQYGWALLGATAAIVVLLLYTAFVLRLNGRLRRTPTLSWPRPTSSSRRPSFNCSNRKSWPPSASWRLALPTKSTIRRVLCSAISAPWPAMPNASSATSTMSMSAAGSCPKPWPSPVRLSEKNSRLPNCWRICPN
ncbi:PhnD/SsuA/transferrin family substrate-binding protein [Desulfuromonas thiophila]|uniref:phosphate/phosphite/phosphonate ABC transporter substrate-binding protein n=1 Tax=Desulfuromonas thiophila TaxID=57664 RepID=UPI0029F5729F|nr:PhnD/SsuA/transferrin family substrate-binding protein [Desulfuromonas thiophila]